MHDAQPVKVFVFRDEDAIMLARELPDALVPGPASSKHANVQRLSEEVAKKRDQLLGELFVKHQPHTLCCRY